MLGYTNLLAAGSLPHERTSHALNAIQRNAQAQSRLIESLLRIIAGKLELDLKRTDARKLVDSALDVVRPEADAKGIVVAVESPSVEVPLVGDGGRLQQVLWNLLSNAVNFTPARGQVHVRLTKSDADIRIEVSDTGQGIKSDFLPYVFDRFKQGDGRSERSSTGLGFCEELEEGIRSMTSDDRDNRRRAPGWLSMNRDSSQPVMVPQVIGSRPLAEPLLSSRRSSFGNSGISVTVTRSSFFDELVEELFASFDDRWIGPPRRW